MLWDTVRYTRMWEVTIANCNRERDDLLEVVSHSYRISLRFEQTFLRPLFLRVANHIQLCLLRQGSSLLRLGELRVPTFPAMSQATTGT
jgi:hypothetical protein